MKSCKSCENRNVEVVYDAGQQPISSKYLKSRNEEEELYSLQLGQCLSCGLVQLMDPVPIQELQLIYEWITYNEPEGHLDDLVNYISQLEGINTESSLLGISYKEDSTLARFGALGFSKIERLPIPKTILGNDETAGMEVVQNYISGKTFSDSSNHSQYDIILLRHILEHTQTAIA